VAEILSTSHLFILPSKSENFGHALYEAMSAGLPVVTSDFTPWNELEKNKAGLNVKLKAGAIAKSIEFFAEMDASDFASWSQGASGYAKNAVDKRMLIRQYEEMFAVGSRQIVSKQKDK
jgi:glycosyltransferase involved in cell wall biosynthesis